MKWASRLDDLYDIKVRYQNTSCITHTLVFSTPILLKTVFSNTSVGNGRRPKQRISMLHADFFRPSLWVSPKGPGIIQYINDWHSFPALWTLDVDQIFQHCMLLFKFKYSNPKDGLPLTVIKGKPLGLETERWSRLPLVQKNQKSFLTLAVLLEHC